MKKHLAVLLLFALLLPLVLTGCSSNLTELNEQAEEMYFDIMNRFFSALETNDTDGIKALFSKDAINRDNLLDGEIERLTAIYPDSKTEMLLDEFSPSRTIQREDGKVQVVFETTIAVICEGEYYWVCTRLISKDDNNSDNVGISTLVFYTIDEYYTFRESEKKTTLNKGLFVYTDLKLDYQLTCIQNHPYRFTPTDKKTNLEEAEAFLRSDSGYDALIRKFGSPNATDSLPNYIVCFYEIEGDGATLYLGVSYTYGELSRAFVCSDRAHVRTIIQT